MKLDSLKYDKAEGTRVEEGAERATPASPVFPSRAPSLPDVPLSSDYTKPEGEIDAHILFILSGGEDRERKYFKMLDDDRQLTRIKVAFASKKGQGLNPTQLLDTAIKSVDSKAFATEERTFRFERKNGDIIYLLQDIDEFFDEIQKLTAGEQPDCIRWICSNPAFEIWLFYHYFKTPLPKLKDAIVKTPAERSRWLKEYLPTIIKGGVKTTKAIQQMRDAIGSSIANYKETEGLPDLFSTQMHILAKDMLDAMGDEFDQMLERKAAYNKAMMEKYGKPIVKGIRYDGRKIRSLIAGFSQWADNHPLRLPPVGDDKDSRGMIVDNRAFPVSYKIEKESLDDDSGQQTPFNMDELFMVNIQQEIYRFYDILFIQNSPGVSYTIDFSEIKETIDRLGLDEHYAILASFSLDTFDDLYGGSPLRKFEGGYLYHNIPIYGIPSTERFLIVMRQEYLPKAGFKPYEGGNSEFEQIDGRNHIYSNIHQMKDLKDHYGLSVMRVVSFHLPHKGSFRFIRLNIVDYAKEKSEADKLSRADIVRLQYQEGDFIMFSDKVRQIIGITEDGGLKTSSVAGIVPLTDVTPVEIDGVHDASIYYAPVIAAFTLNPDEPIPTAEPDDSYYMESFKKEFLDDGSCLFDKVVECHFRYVHELQHWLLATQGQSGLKVR